MAYLARGQNSPGAAAHTINALQGALDGSPYELQHPVAATNHAGWEVQCLLDRLGWINTLRDRAQRPLVFVSRQDARDFMASMALDGAREYRLYPSISAA